MRFDLALLIEAKKLLEQEWRQAGRAAGDRPADAFMAQRPPEDLLPDLIELLAESCDQPAHHLCSVIRRRVREKCFVSDFQPPAPRRDQLETQVQVLVRVLEQLRLDGLARGHWSNAPVTPMMFG